MTMYNSVEDREKIFCNLGSLAIRVITMPDRRGSYL
jgi:hypothetical protein